MNTTMLNTLKIHGIRIANNSQETEENFLENFFQVNEKILHIFTENYRRRDKSGIQKQYF